MTKDDLNSIRQQHEQHQSKLRLLNDLALAAQSNYRRASYIARADSRSPFAADLRAMDADSQFLCTQIEAMKAELLPAASFWSVSFNQALAEYNEGAPARRQAMADEWRKNQ